MVSQSMTAGTGCPGGFRICNKAALLRDMIKETPVSPYYRLCVHNKTKYQAAQLNSWKCSEVSQFTLVKLTPVITDVTVVLLGLNVRITTLNMSFPPPSCPFHCAQSHILLIQ